MSGFQRHDRDLSKYDHMSTEDLEAILRADFELPEGEESDMEKILYVTEVIARRRGDKPTGRYANAGEAWDAFVTHYLPGSKNEAAFHRAAGTDKPAEEAASDTEATGKPLRVRRMLLRAAAIAAIVAVLVSASTVTASAFRFDFWGWLNGWTQQVFGMQSNTLSTSDDIEIPEQLAELKAYMDEYGFPDNLLPTYLPDGYEMTATKCRANSIRIEIKCLLNKDDSEIILEYTMYLNDNVSVTYEKDGDDPEEYVAGNVSHYIVTNYDDYVVSWTTDNVACLWAGIDSRADLNLMIESIYGG